MCLNLLFLQLGKTGRTEFMALVNVIEKTPVATFGQCERVIFFFISRRLFTFVTAALDFGFASFSQSTKIKKGSKGDTSVLKPTLMAAVPVSLLCHCTHP